ncbi:MAG: SDR family NAD(P)-dependent oxidoreductase [Chloroflexi bacterium]|nr:SDR family NAD(P)-dependent oxidoreductase [Chloroflexota bacterium]
MAPRTCILLTGAAGFIGSKVAELLLADGHSVVGVDNLNDAYDPRLKHWRLAQLQGKPDLTFQHLDICDRAELQKLFHTRFVEQGAGFEAVINLAARAGVRQSVENPWVYFETNVVGTLNLLELCRQFGVKKFVLASTSSLYGAHNPQPFHEEANTDRPLSPYAASKKAAEGLCYTYHFLHGLDITLPRYFTVYGPAGRPDMSLFRFVQWISEQRPVTVYGDGQQSRDFTYVDDIARGTVAALKPLGYEVINLGSDEPVVLSEAIHLVEELVGKQANIVYKPRDPADVMATWADIHKAERLLGWRPTYSFRQGVAQLVHWYQENRDWAREIITS